MDYREKIDYSSLSTYMDCPRKFLFQYVMHLRGAGKSIHLVFGSCWHYGLEKAYLEMQSQQQSNGVIKLTVMDLTIISVKAFNALWDLDGAPHWKDEDVIFPKSPGHAANMFKAYWERHLKLDTDDGRKVVAVEAPFVIDLSSYRCDFPNYIGRIDLILSAPGNGIEIIDHKTAKSVYKVSPQIFESSFQTDGYLTAGRLFYDKIPSITYRLAICQKAKIDFHPITVNKRSAAIDHFLVNLTQFVSKILDDLDWLVKDRENCVNRTDVLQSFNRCPGNACTAFFTQCPYYNLCRLRNNPLSWFDKAPQGYTHDEWDPDTHEEGIKTRLAEASKGK
ncbi:MAG: PD-(D/E)XK nuclease family protein [Thiomicrorhabdus sp.]|jgi:hypothetical protein|nr:PD-(D/E)XK nuclease family protein [Thiomicrorhabdus sp.]